MPFPGYKPVHEDFLTKIVEVHWPEDDEVNYVTLFYSIYRKGKSVGADIAITDYPDQTRLIEYADMLGVDGSDTLLQTLISYRNVVWPVFFQGGNVFPAPQPYDVPPNEGHQNAFTLPGVIGAPALPGVSSFGSEAECRFLMGFVVGNQSSGFYPGIRAISPGGGFNPRYDDPPDPPKLSQGGTVWQINPWGFPSVSIQLYEVLLNGGAEHNGETLDSFDLDYSTVRVELGGTWYRAAALATIPREEGFVRHHPPYTGAAVGENGSNHQAEFNLLCERMTDDEAAAEGL